MSTPTPPDLSKTYGAAMVGLLVACFLSGITTLQTYLYFQNGSRDKLFLKLIVTTLWTIDMLHLGGISAFVYHYTISNWGNLNITGHSMWALGLEEILNTWITFIAQMFFIHRIIVLSNGKWWPSIPLFILAFVQLGFGTGGGIKSMLPQTVRHLASTRWRAAIWLISGAVNDIMIATILCYNLCTERSVMNQRLVDQLIAYTMTTGLLTSVIAFVDIGCFIAMPGNYIHLAFNFVLGRLYANSLLASLNMRRYIRRTNVYRMNSGGLAEYPTVSNTQTGTNGRPKVTINALPVHRDDLTADGIYFYHGRSETCSRSAETCGFEGDVVKGVMPTIHSE